MEGESIINKQTYAGPANIFSTTVERDLETTPIRGEGSENIDPLTFKSLKLKNGFNPKVFSTCPIVPKFHRTFGKAKIYESVSAERELEHDPA